MDIESFRVAEETARWAYWSMIAASVSACCAFATAIIAFMASRAWRKQERLNQLVKLKRTTFDYHSMAEKIGLMQQDGKVVSDLINNEMTEALGRIFQELALAGLDNDACTQGKLFGELKSEHRRYQGRIGDGSCLYKAVMELQKSIVVRL